MTADAPLAGRVAIVTGAARGIGAVVTEHLSRDGADVALVGRDLEALRSRALLIDEKYPDRQSLAVRCDVTNEDDVMATKALRHWMSSNAINDIPYVGDL